LVVAPITFAALSIVLGYLNSWPIGFDFRGTLCDPDNHFVTGHAVWHVLTAVSLLCFFQFHARLRAEPA